MPNFRHYIFRPNAAAPELVELFVVSAVAAALAIRCFLALAGSPPPDAGALRLAPVLWGGMLLLPIALLLLFTALGRNAQRTAAIIAGIGFGASIDELGRFITADYSYLYQPAIGFGYIIFVSLFLSLRPPLLRNRLTPDAALSSALTLLAAAPGGRPYGSRRQEILRLLSRADPINPLVTALSAYVSVSDAWPDTGRPGSPFAVRRRLAQWYRSIALHPRYRAALSAFFILYAAAHCGMAVYFAVSDAAAVLAFNVQAQLASSIVAAMVAAFGIGRLRHSRPDAYLWFARAVLFNILLTQVFAFPSAPLATLCGLTINLLAYAALRYMTQQEQTLTPDANAPYADPTAGRSPAPSLSSGECG